jgi:serine phosphatase RsbU (regulator of sigma subunit)
LLYANAGHNGPLVIDDSGVKELVPTGMIFGPLPVAPLERAYAHIAKNAILVMLTDGLLERFNVDNEMFGTEGIIEVVSDLRKEDPDTILEAVFEASMAFGNSEVFDDDASLVIVKRDG